jgi:hypothetical protein
MPDNLEKIIVPLPEDNLARAVTESMWGEPEGHNVYRIKNVPFLAKGFSRDDLVKAELRNGVLTYQCPLQHSGHSTYQVYVKVERTDPLIKSLIERLAEMQCVVEFASDRFFSVDVLPKADIYAVYAELERAEAAGLIDFQEGHCGHKLSV